MAVEVMRTGSTHKNTRGSARNQLMQWPVHVVKVSNAGGSVTHLSHLVRRLAVIEQTDDTPVVYVAGVSHSFRPEMLARTLDHSAHRGSSLYMAGYARV